MVISRTLMWDFWHSVSCIGERKFIIMLHTHTFTNATIHSVSFFDRGGRAKVKYFPLMLNLHGLLFDFCIVCLSLVGGMNIGVHVALPVFVFLVFT